MANILPRGTGIDPYRTSLNVDFLSVTRSNIIPAFSKISLKPEKESFGASIHNLPMNVPLGRHFE
jgi:hypothetical protein